MLSLGRATAKPPARHLSDKAQDWVTADTYNDFFLSGIPGSAFRLRLSHQIGIRERSDTSEGPCLGLLEPYQTRDEMQNESE